MLLKKLTEAMGPSGFEDEIRNVIREEVTPYVDKHYTDVLGTLICEKGVNKNGPRVMLDAHMDEVGLMIVHVEENGLLRFRPLGEIDPRVLVSKPVQIGPQKRFGVIGAKPIHLQSPEERDETALSETALHRHWSQGQRRCPVCSEVGRRGDVHDEVRRNRRPLCEGEVI